MKQTELVRCACGCGVEFKKRDRYGRVRRFLFGHGTKGRALKNLFKNTNMVDGCLEFSGARTANGYGSIRINNKGYLAHRIAYEVANGIKLSSKDVVMHSCDNPPCINTDHLILGTHLSNRHDSLSKGRTVGAMLDDNDVMAIRSRVENGERQHVIATEYGCSQPHISKIVNSKRRENVPCL